RVGDLLHVGDAEIVLLARCDAAALAQKALDIGLHFRGIDPVPGRDIYGVDVGIAGDTPVEGADRHEDHVVPVGADAGLALLLQDTDHLAGHVAQANALADGAGGAEQLLVHGPADDADGPAATRLAVKKVPPIAETPVLRDDVARVSAYRANA